ncbi:MAG: hypothetical protein ACYCOU_25135 [Sulfobacillus sp.]
MNIIRHANLRNALIDPMTSEFIPTERPDKISSLINQRVAFDDDNTLNKCRDEIHSGPEGPESQQWLSFMDSD